MANFLALLGGDDLALMGGGALLLESQSRVPAFITASIGIGIKIKGVITVNNQPPVGLLPLYIGSTNLIKITGVTDALTNEALTDASLSASLTDGYGTAIAGAQGIALDYDSDVSAYVGVTPANIGLKEACRYVLNVTLTEDADTVLLSIDCQGQRYHGG
jgi:hypothetical protein